jgi:hypothetical protein
VLILGIAGIAAVMHRHWPSSTKMLAAGTAAGAIGVLVLYRAAHYDWADAMFATRWFIVFTPMLLFWSGAWLRKSHTTLTWAAAGVALLFSLCVGLIGETDPAPRHGFTPASYTAASALERLLWPEEAADAETLAGRGM